MIENVSDNLTSPVVEGLISDFRRLLAGLVEVYQIGLVIHQVVFWR